ncbi:MAG: winged helix-turn-helix transcriptional regulator [Chloroflexi bacterium]|nr:winged helix-turn-helix transcriptional regulator [Chloroflexota bacterium]
MTTKSDPLTSVEFAKVLADPTRQEIMQLTCCEALNVSEIVEAVGVSQPTVSHHLAILRDAGLVSVRSEGKNTYYELNQECVALCCGNIMQVLAPETEAAQVYKESTDVM